MNILFLTLAGIRSVEDRGIYQDLLRTFRERGHSVTIVSPVQRREGLSTRLQSIDGVSILQVKTLNITKANLLEKGIGTLAIEHQFLHAIKKHLPTTRFDLILYSTPPITFAKVIDYIKRRDNALSYLLLKDIFPQNAVDMGMLKKGGLLHRFFRRKEKKLYRLSDWIGCMSPANAAFVTRHNPEVDRARVEVTPNAIEPVQLTLSTAEKQHIRDRYQLPQDKIILVYGGNLGKPQGLDFLLETIAANRNPNAFFLIVGDGTQFPRIQRWFDEHRPHNAQLLQRLPKEDYDRVLAACDIGLIFLAREFLIPNFPSRLLSYLEMRKPVIAATDPNTDIGDIIEQAGCGYKVLADDADAMAQAIDQCVNDDKLAAMGENGWQLLQDKYLVTDACRQIETKLRQLDP